MAFDIPAENLLLKSRHDKNNVNVGTTVSAVNRYHKVEKIFESNAVDHFDHSFPVPNSKIKSGGYMKLGNKGSVVPGVAAQDSAGLYQHQESAKVLYYSL